MRKIVLKLKNSNIFKKVLYISICVVIGIYIFSLPSFSGKAPLNIISYGTMVLLVACVFLYFFLYKKFTFERKVLIPFVFVIDSFICTMISNPENWRRCVSVLLMAATFIIVFYSCKCIDNERLILKIVLFAFFAFAIYFSLVPEYTSKILHFSISMSNRLGGYFDNVNLIASYFAIAFGISLYLGITSKNKREYLYLVFCLPFAYLGLFTGSRAFIVLLFVLFVSISYIRFRNRKFVFFIILSCFIVLMIILVSSISVLRFQFEKIMYTLFGIGNPDVKKIDSSSVERVLWMRYGFTLGSKHILIGLGCEGFATYSGVDTYTHNNYAELLCDFGIPGFLVFLFIIFYPFLLHFVGKKEGASIIIPFTFYYLVKSMFGVFYYYKDFYLIMGICYYMVDDVAFADFSNKITHLFNKNNSKMMEINI